MMMMKTSVVFLAIAVLSAAVQGFILKIDPKAEECFYENVPKDENVHVVFQVLEGGDMDISFSVMDADKNTLISESGRTQGKYDFKAAKDGYYKICFRNDMGSFSSREISMDINVGDGVKTAFDRNKDSLSPLEERIVTLSDGIRTIKEDQEYILMQDIAHKHINDRTNLKVLYWFVFQLILILSLGAWQVYYVTRFFEVKRVV